MKLHENLVKGITLAAVGLFALSTGGHIPAVGQVSAAEHHHEHEHEHAEHEHIAADSECHISASVALAMQSTVRDSLTTLPAQVTEYGACEYHATENIYQRARVDIPLFELANKHTTTLALRV